MNPKIIFIMGATGTGKSKLSVDIATRFPAEIINSDKIQAYQGLDIVTNKIPEAERGGIPHHLIGVISDPSADFSAAQFTSELLSAASAIISGGKTPIVVGGSNSYLEALVDSAAFRAAGFVSLFLLLHVEPDVLFSHVDRRIDQMVSRGLVEEIGAFLEPEADFSRGIWRAIGVPELEKYFLSSGEESLLKSGIEEMKANTRSLVLRQVEKIQRLKKEVGWDIRRLDATEVFKCGGDEAVQEALWNELVLSPSLEFVSHSLKSGDNIPRDVTVHGGGDLVEKKMVAI